MLSFKSWNNANWFYGNQTYVFASVTHGIKDFRGPSKDQLVILQVWPKISSKIYRFRQDEGNETLLQNLTEKTEAKSEFTRPYKNPINL